MHELWLELSNDIATPIVYWQLMLVLFCLAAASAISGLVQLIVLKRFPEEWKVGAGGVKRILFPLLAISLLYVGKMVLRQWQHTSVLTLAMTLLLAMAIIRLVVYILRYVFLPSPALKAAEGSVVGVIWLVFALHLVGWLPELTSALDEVGFNFGKHRISLLLMIQAGVTVLITVIAALSLSRFIENKLMGAEQINMNLRVVLTKLVRVLLTLAGVLAALSAVGFDITLLSVFGGALGVGLGFGLQKIASNYVSGFIILLDESVHLEDVVTIGEHYGVIKQIRSRYLVLRKLDGTEVVIPNETLITEAVINHSFSDRRARVLLPIQIGYDTDLDRAMSIILDVAENNPRVLKDPAADVQITGFGESGIDLQLVLWIPDPEEGSASLKSAVYRELWKAFQIHGISIPYPHREIRIISEA